MKTAFVLCFVHIHSNCLLNKLKLLPSDVCKYLSLILWPEGNQNNLQFDEYIRLIFCYFFLFLIAITGTIKLTTLLLALLG